MSFPPRALRRKPGRSPGWVLPVLVFVLSGLSLAIFWPSFQELPVPPESRPYLVYRGDRHDFPVVVERGEAYVPFSFIKEVIDPNAFYDKDGVVVVTTANQVVKMKTGSLTGYVNRHPVELKFPVVLEGKEPYIPGSTLEILYPVSVSLKEEAGVFRVRQLDEDRVVAPVVSRAFVRVRSTMLSERAGRVGAGDEVEIFETAGRWARIETWSGVAGWLPVSCLGEKETRRAEGRPSGEYVPTPFDGKKVVLVWEQVERRTPDPSGIGPMEGLNVVSPTWFRLGEKPGEVENYADSRYVAWAHSQGYQVWALFSNSFELERTRAVLRSSDFRDKVISQILIYAEVYSLDGINIDFENVYKDDAPYLTQFVRELTPLLHEQGLTVSMDVTVKSQSPTWSLCYERKRLSEVLDYIMLMAYDQYGATSKVAGPVSAIPWTEWTIEKTLEEVPKEKLVLGIPFYTRLWKETKEGASVTVSQKAMGMESAEQWFLSEKVTPVLQTETGLRYAEKTSGSVTYRMWLEDEDSVRRRLDLARAYDLAGVAAWRRGFERKSVWNVISDYPK